MKPTIYKTLGEMKRCDLTKWAIAQRAENVRLQKRIANMRATYRRFVGSLQKNLEENQQRRQEAQGVTQIPEIERRAG